MRPVIDFICGFRACAGVISGGNSGGLMGRSESSLIENASFGSWRWRFNSFLSDLG